MKLDAELRNQLLNRARQMASDRGWPWQDPVELKAMMHEGEAVWAVRTNALMRGDSIRVLIRQSDHVIVHSGYLSR